MRIVLIAIILLLMAVPVSRVPGPGVTWANATQIREEAALVILSTHDIDAFHAAMDIVQQNGGDALQGYPPAAFVARLTLRAEAALRLQAPGVTIERGQVRPADLTRLGADAAIVAHIWNTIFQGIPDPLATPLPGPPPTFRGPDFIIPPEAGRGVRAVAGAPSSTQTSEFMAGKVAVAIIFVESSSIAGNCSDTLTETWSDARKTTVLGEISEGLAFWTGRAMRPKPLTFVLDNQGSQLTSCEPIKRPHTDEGKWIADILSGLGFAATTANYQDKAREYANARRNALKTNWAYVIFVVDSDNDADGLFSDGFFAYAYLNGAFMVMTYDNDGWGIGRMDKITAHETGHIFGALDEYSASGCSTADTWGYLNVANASCNNGGVTTDLSIMGEASEQEDPMVDVSTSARGAIGWRNPIGNIVDVVRTSTVKFTALPPDPTTDRTPTYAAEGSNKAFPPGGCNTIGSTCFRTPSAVNIATVKGAQWRLDSGSFTSTGVVPTDGKFDEETDPYTFTPTSDVAPGTHTFSTRARNNFGHQSKKKSDTLTIN